MRGILGVFWLVLPTAQLMPGGDTPGSDPIQSQLTNLLAVGSFGIE